MYPFVSGDFKPVERRKNVISYGKSGRVEAGMKHKSFTTFYKFSVTEFLWTKKRLII